ncbi:MAG: NAD-dependent epimerase/dehydratase family protein, partial [Candidatus Rokubacteria bacterium]|nr:NAD-dependent epimerase/dehydratase family protein [Candidatus Rokubacteria bacterium]
MNVLVTGGLGFIGTNLVERLRGPQFRVRLLDDLSAHPGATAPPEGADAWTTAPGFVRADVCDVDAMVRACRGADAVIHLAASTGIPDSLRDPLAHCETNATGTLVVLEACRRAGVARCVVASSGAAVGDAPPPIHERAVPSPVSPYGASKLAAEAYCQAYRGAFGLATHALRFSNVYGPHSGHKTSAVATFIGTVLEDRPLTIYGDGEQTRDFVFVGDLVDGVAGALTAERAAQCVYQLGSAVETSINALVALLRDVAMKRLGRDVRVEHRPPRPGEV